MPHPTNAAARPHLRLPNDASKVQQAALAIDEMDGSFINERKDFLLSRSLDVEKAVERDVEIIGKTMNRMVTNDTNSIIRITSAKPIVGWRYQGIHANDPISDENTWSTSSLLFQNL